MALLLLFCETETWNLELWNCVAHLGALSSGHRAKENHDVPMCLPALAFIYEQTISPLMTSLPFSLFSFYSLSYLLSKAMGCFSGRLMSSASDQKLFCGVCSVIKCSFDEFVGEKVVSLSYSSAVFDQPPFSYCTLHIIWGSEEWGGPVTPESSGKVPPSFISATSCPALLLNLTLRCWSETLGGSWFWGVHTPTHDL